MAVNIVTTKGTFNDNEIKGKVIRKPHIARQILEKGKRDVWLFDIKPAREDPQNKTVFIFEDTEKFQEIFAQVLAENKHDEESSNAAKIRDLEREIEELKKAAEVKKEG